MGVKVRWHHNQFYIFVNHKGKREAHKAGTNEAKANKVAKELESALLRGTLGLKTKTKGNPTLEDYFTTWLSLDGPAGQRLKVGAIDTYRNNADCYILPFMGKTLVGAITHEQCIELIKSWKAKGHRSATLKLIARTLSSALTDAVEYLPVNPAFKMAKYFRCPDEIKHKVRWYTREESDKFLATAQLGDPQMYRLWLIALRAGLRHGELIGLTWGDLDFTAKQINVARSLDREGLNPTAPKHGQRFVDMSDELVEILEPVAGQFDRDAYISASPKGTPWQQRTVLKRLHRMTKAAHTRRLDMHELRHTFASQLLQDGAPMLYVKEQMGHSSIQITVDLYGHLAPSANRKWVNRLTAGAAQPMGATA